MADQEQQDKTPLTKEELEYFRSLLMQKRQEILSNVKAMEEETLKRERTDLSNMPLHMGDIGSDTFELDNALTLVDSERQLLEEIDEALERIEQGTYGICLGSGRPISKKRLQAIPWTKYSIEYATEMERSAPNKSVPRTAPPPPYPDEDAA
ncbi:MAG: TraR/DksA C4-type zinc finger protein [Sedimentisphaerales bacterium]|nr:TraR/DksA C4-type zinc finger protein [Sedimentisphaerales bacterium]